MNKKLFSAALFGALLLGTASTFVSCKDYDDDIAGLQTQINDVKAAVSALEAKISAGKFVSGVTSTADGITIALSDGSSYTITNGKDGAPGKDGVNGENGAPGKDGAAGADAQQVTVDEKTGELMINGKGTGIKPATEVAKAEFKAPVKAEGGFWYVLNEKGEYDNTKIAVSPVTVTGSDATGYVLTVYNADGTSTVVALPTEASTLEGVTVSNGTFTSVAIVSGTPTVLPGIVWGTAAGADAKWAGSLGAIAKDQLLIGQITTANVTVTPATYALDQQTLTLVASNGSVAPVKVTATAAAGVLTTTRAAQSGAWTLAIEMDKTVTKDNIETVFTNGLSGAAARNLKYALAINGKVVSGYDFAIDTQVAGETGAVTAAAATTTANVIYPAYVTSTTMPFGSTTLGYNDPAVCDAYLTFDGADADVANAYNVKVDGMTVTAPESAATKTVNATLHILDIAGTATTTPISFTFAASKVDAGSIAATKFTVDPYVLKPIVIELGDAFKSMSAAQITAVDYTKTTVSVKGTGNDAKFIYAMPTSSTVGAFVEKFDAAGNPVNFNTASGLLTLKYLIIPATTDGTTAGMKATAKPGDYTIVLALKDAAGNEIKKIEMPVTIALPTLEDVLTKSSSWNGNSVKLNVNASGAGDFKTAYTIKKALGNATVVVNFSKVDDTNYPVTATSGAVAITASGTPVSTSGAVTLNNYAVKDGAIKDLKAETVMTIGGNSNFVVKSGEYTVQFTTPLAGVKLFNHDKDGKDTAIVVNGTAGDFGFCSATGASGVGYLLNSKAYALENLLTIGTPVITFDEKAGSDAAATITASTPAGPDGTPAAVAGKLSITGLAPANGTAYTTVMTITVADATISGATVKAVLTIPVTVQP